MMHIYDGILIWILNLESCIATFLSLNIQIDWMLSLLKLYGLPINVLALIQAVLGTKDPTGLSYLILTLALIKHFIDHILGSFFYIVCLHLGSF